MRLKTRRDSNELEIVKALKKAGCSVIRMDTPCDLLVGLRNKNYLIEIKTINGKILGSQEEFKNEWNGQISIARTIEDAYRICDIIK